MPIQCTQNIFRTISDTYNEFAMESTIHGIKYTAQAKSTFVRLMWLMIVITSLFTAGVLAKLFYERHQSASMSTLVISSQFPAWKLSLPAVTICHESIVVASKVKSFLTSQKKIYLPKGLTNEDFEKGVKYLRQIIYPTNDYQEELDKLQLILNANRISILELLENVSPNCSEFVMLCRFQGTTVPCKEILRSVITPYGICCTFNYENTESVLLSSEDSDFKEYPHGVTFGAQFILSFLLNSIPLSERLSSIIHGNGFKVMIHQRYSYPGPSAEEFVAATGYETVARLYGTYLISSQEVLDLPPHVRECRSSKSISSIAENCYVKCRELIIRKFCSCLPFSVPMVDVTHRMCNLSDITCLARITEEIHSISMSDPQCNCRPNCEDTTFEVTVSMLPFDAPRFKPGKFSKKALQYQNATALHITYAGQTAMLQRTELVLSSINLVSSLGGVFSLFLGCSFISLIEIFYFFCINLFYKMRNKQNVNTSIINETSK